MRGVIGTRHTRVTNSIFHSGWSAEKHSDRPRPASARTEESSGCQGGSPFRTTGVRPRLRARGQCWTAPLARASCLDHGLDNSPAPSRLRHYSQKTTDCLHAARRLRSKASMICDDAADDVASTTERREAPLPLTRWLAAVALQVLTYTPTSLCVARRAVALRPVGPLTSCDKAASVAAGSCTGVPPFTSP